MFLCVCVVGLRIWLVLPVGVCVLSEFSSVQWRLFSLLYCIIIRQFLTICTVLFHFIADFDHILMIVSLLSQPCTKFYSLL